jgi:hypothetical protein
MNMFFGTTLDLTNVDPNAGSFSPVPEGEYKVVCTDFDYGEKFNDKNQRVGGAKVKFQILEGEYAGRKVNDYFIIRHDGSADAQRIGQARLRSWCDALGVHPSLESAEVLLHKPVMAKVKVDSPRTVNGKTYNEQNRIESFLPADGAQVAAKPATVMRPAAAASPAKAAVVAAPAQAAAKGKMPWDKR